MPFPIHVFPGGTRIDHDTEKARRHSSPHLWEVPGSLGRKYNTCAAQPVQIADSEHVLFLLKRTNLHFERSSVCWTWLFGLFFSGWGFHKRCEQCREKGQQWNSPTCIFHPWCWVLFAAWPWTLSACDTPARHQVFPASRQMETTEISKWCPWVRLWTWLFC